MMNSITFWHVNCIFMFTQLNQDICMVKQMRETLSIEEAIEQLKQFDQEISNKRKHFIGYPINANISLTPFFKWWTDSLASHSPLNDVGNPDQDLPYLINARHFEREVLDIFAHLLKFHPYWGFITS